MNEKTTYGELERIIEVQKDNIKDIVEINRQQADALDRAAKRISDHLLGTKSEEDIKNELMTATRKPEATK